jgi:hypothetical protein
MGLGYSPRHGLRPARVCDGRLNVRAEIQIRFGFFCSFRQSPLREESAFSGM